MDDSRALVSYWTEYYSKGHAPILPSQFAAFVANEFPDHATLLDVGCGNGRDALYFASIGKTVRALDWSEAAIVSCRERLAQIGMNGDGRSRFVVGEAQAPAAWAELTEGIAGPAIVYSRFFFHAIDDEVEAGVLARTAEFLRVNGGVLAAEFRSHLDADQQKVTPSHYRRYIEPEGFAARLADHGFSIVWRAEGRGMAKYKADDAYVARFVAQP